MANVSQQYQQQQPPTNATKSAYYGSATTYQQPQHAVDRNYYGNYGSSSAQQTTHWNGQSNGYTNNQTGNYFTATPHQSSAGATYQSTHWYKSQTCQPSNVCYGQNTDVATSNRSGIKRTYSTEAPLNDITNNAHNGTNLQKRRKFTTINTHTGQVLNYGVQRKTTAAQHNVHSPTSSSFDPSTGKVRIESIFRHVELLAQSYWQSGCPSAPVFKPTTVDALEGRISTH